MVSSVIDVKECEKMSVPGENCPDTESLVRLHSAQSPLQITETDPDKSDKCNIERPTPHLPTTGHDKKLWMSGMSPVLPTPILPLPTLNFTVAQVRT